MRFQRAYCPFFTVRSGCGKSARFATRIAAELSSLKGTEADNVTYCMIDILISVSYYLYMSPFLASTENDTKQQSVTSRVNDNGRIVIPANIRKSMGLKPGDVVVMSLEDGVLRIESHLARIRRIQEEFKKFVTPGTLASDELIADRREEARREMEESLG